MYLSVQGQFYNLFIMVRGHACVVIGGPSTCSELSATETAGPGAPVSEAPSLLLDILILVGVLWEVIVLPTLSFC